MKKKLEIETTHDTEDCGECNALVTMAFSMVANNGEKAALNVRFANYKTNEYHCAEVTELM